MPERDLPPELWARIFSLTSGCRADIASCRLVSRSFCTISSEYFITKAVVAKRSSSLQRLWDVLEHPVFRRHVTELIYDASHYQQSIASDTNVYAYVCNKFCSRVHLRQGPEARMNKLNHLSLRIRRSKASCDLGDNLDTELAGHLDFCSESLEYSRRWLDQESIVAKNLHLDSLECALRRLPNLRKITYTDFRYLAIPGEPYLDLCQRLFASIVEPTGVKFGSEHGMAELVTVLKVVRGTPEAHIRSLSIGGHPYEFPEIDIGRPLLERTYIHLPWTRAALPYTFLDSTGDDDVSGHTQALAADLDFVLALEGLKHLRLPVNIPLQDALNGDFEPNVHLPGSHLISFLQCNASTLVRLELLAAEDKLDDDEDEETVVDITHGFLAALLDGLVFKSLHCLELHNWQLREARVLQDFFIRHSSTLREVRLLGCTLYEDPSHIARWVGEHMSLTGVDIDIWPGSFVDDDEDDDNDDGDNNDDIDIDEASYSTFIDEKMTTFDNERCLNKEGGFMKEEEIMHIQNWSDLTKAELEEIWLAGRCNTLHGCIRASSPLAYQRLFKDSAPN